VLDANQRSALAVTRSLGRQGVPVITADESSTALASQSRYSESYLKYPSPRYQSEDFIAFIIAVTDQHEIEIIMPMTELTTTLLLAQRDALGGVVLPFADATAVDTLTDKCQLMQLAEELEVPIPRTWYVTDPMGLPDNLSSLPYPLILKPGKSWQTFDHIWRRNGVHLAHSVDEARTLLTSDLAFSRAYMLQECVPGEGRGIFALYDQGRPITFFAHRRLREKPPSGGVSVLSESAAPDPRMLAHARALLDRVGWHGVAMVEFKFDPQTQIPYLMEVNTRFWGSLQLAVDAGVDFPWWLYQMACGMTLKPTESYRTGLRTRWLLGDLDNLYLNLRNKELGKTEKLRCLLRFMTPRPRTRHEVNRWSDLRPFWWELRQYVRDLLS